MSHQRTLRFVSALSLLLAASIVLGVGTLHVRGIENNMSVASTTGSVTLTASQDTYVYEGLPNTNLNGTYEIHVGGSTGSRLRGLVQFDVSLPQYAQVTSATLRLSVVINMARSPEAVDQTLTVWVRSLNHGWSEEGVTWTTTPLSTSKGDPPTTVEVGYGYESWDVTNIVAAWADGTLNNNGLLLLGDGSDPDSRGFHAHEYASAAPKLDIEYVIQPPTNTPTRTPTSTRTPTRTPTATRRPPTNTPTTRATSTPTTRPTNTPTTRPTSTATTRPTRTPTTRPTSTATTRPTRTPTTRPTSTATPTPKSGVVGSCPGQVWVYADRDTWVESANPSAVHGTENRLQLHKYGSDRTAVLLRFPLAGVIPAGQYVSTAWVEMYAFDASSLTKHVDVNLYTLAGSIMEPVVSWQNKPAKGMSLGQRQVTGSGQSLDVTDAARAWKDGTDPNHGLYIEPVSDDFFYEYGSREYWVSPPVLKFYCSGDEPSPTPTPTRTRTPTATSTVEPICPGDVYIYADADTWVDSRHPAQSHGSDDSLRMDHTASGEDAGQAFTYLHFPKVSLLEGYHITSARLMLRRPHPLPSPPATMARIRVLDEPFSEATTNYGNRPDWSGDYLGWMEMETWQEFPIADVTEALQAIYEGDAPNHGFRLDAAYDGLAYFDSREGLAKPELKIGCSTTNLEVTPDALEMDLAPLYTLTGPDDVDVTADVEVIYATGSAQPLELSIEGLPDDVSYAFTPAMGTSSFTSVLRLSADRDDPPALGSHNLTVRGTAGTVDLQQPVTLDIVSSGDLRLLHISPVQSVYGAIPPLVQDKGTAFRVNVRNTFPGPVEAQIKLVLPPSEWTTTPTCGNGQTISLPDGWKYPEVWGPVRLESGDSELMLPYVAPGKEEMGWYVRNPAGLLRCGCVGPQCTPDIRVLPRPSAGHASYRAELDPSATIAESDETNNSNGTISSWVKDTQPWNFLFFRCKDPTDGQDYPSWSDVTTAAQLQLEYLMAVFPIADAELVISFAPWPVMWENDEAQAPPDCSGETCYRPRAEFLTDISNTAQSLGFKFAVAMGCGPGGASGTIQAVFVGPNTSPDATVLAHEFNHAVAPMPDIYSLDVAGHWFEAYCEMNGTRVWGCWTDTEKPDGSVWPYCVMNGAEVDCSTTYTKVCAADCGPYDDDWAQCRADLDAVVDCAANGGSMYRSPDARIYHPASPGFWVRRWLPIDGANYFMDANPGSSWPAYWMRVDNTYAHGTGEVFPDGYRNLLDNARIAVADAAAAQTAVANPAALLVSGRVTQAGRATLAPFLTLDDPAVDLQRGARGAYELRLLDSRDALLSAYGFDLLFYQTDPNGGPLDETGFSYRIGWHPDTREIQLWHGGRRLASREVTMAAPRVALLSPNGGTFERTDVIRVRWTATDADGPALTYDLALSPDAGRTWLPVVRGLTESRYDLPADTLTGGSYLLRVSATDGVNTGYDISDPPFEVEFGAIIHLPLVVQR